MAQYQNISSVYVARASAGLGLFARRAFQKGERIVEYIGERIKTSEADKRKSKYLFEINSVWTIDGATRANIARYANHACVPNAESRISNGRVYLYARKRIRPEEEITYDYGEEYVAEHIAPRGCKCVTCAS